MTDEYVYNPLDRTTYEAIAYNAVGRASEIATYPALSLTHSSGNSGWSVGAVQWDFGQPGRGHMVAPLLDGYQQWALPNERFNAQELASLSHRLQTRGQVGNALTDAEHSRISSYLRSDGGREFAARLNQEQIDRKWQNVGQPLSEIAWLQRLNTQDPAQAAEIVAMTSKLYNQNENKGGELIRHLQDTALTSALTSAWIGSQGIEDLKPSARSAIVSGRDGTLTGIRLMNDLELGDGRLSQAWHQEVHIKGNVGLTQEFNINPDIQLFDGMMRNPVAGARIFATVDENAPAHTAIISGINAEARLEMASIEQDRTGVLTVESPNGDRYQMTRAGWDRNGIPMQEVQDYDRRVTPFSPVSPLSSVLKQTPSDPRDSEHPDHAMNQGVREQIRTLYAEHGVALTDQQLDCTTACVMADARRSGMTKVTALEFSEDYATGKPDLNGNLIAYQGDPNNPATKYSATETQRAAMTQPEDSYRQFGQTTQERSQVQAQFLAQQEQIAQSQSAQTRTI